MTTLMIVLSQLKTFLKSFIQKRQMTKTATAELFSKISNKQKILDINNFTTARLTFF